MAQLQNQFNANAIDPHQGGGVNQFPVGKHPVIIIGSQIKGNKDQTGGYIEFELQATAGPAQGSTMPMRLNVYNASEKARQIAEGQLSALCHAVGQFMITDTQQLHQLPFVVDVTAQSLTPEQQEKQARGEQVTPFTQVRKILDIQGNEPKAGGNGGQQSQQQQAPQQSNPGYQQSQPQGQQQAPQGNGGWGGGQQQQNPNPQGNGNAAWGGSQQSQQQQAPQGGNGGGWQQQQQSPTTGGAPAWGR